MITIDTDHNYLDASPPKNGVNVLYRNRSGKSNVKEKTARCERTLKYLLNDGHSMKFTEDLPTAMAVMHGLQYWLSKLDEVWIWITSSLLSVFAVSSSEKKQAVLDWVASYVTQPPTDFAECWRNGILLCELADKFSPELFHGVGILDPKNCFHNVSLALEIIKARFEIDTDVTPEDIVTCAPDAENKLLHLLLKLKEKVESKGAEDAESLNEMNSVNEESSDSTENDCFAQGAGLMVGFLGHKANFIVFSNNSLSDTDLVVEIKGPDGTQCCERITKRSPKRKNTLSYLDAPRSRIAHCGKSRSQTDLWSTDDTLKKNPKVIPLEYEIKDDFISVGYVPLKTGPHTIILLWHGRYVTGCPFVAVIEDSFDVHRNTSHVVRPPILRKATTQKTSLLKRPSVSFKDPESNKVKLGKVKSRRVLRYIVKIGKKDVIVEAGSSDMLASALQKLDFPSEGFFLGPRRNTWGFVGDTHSQRRQGLMKQLCFDNDGEHQDQGRPQKRTSSLNLPMRADTNNDDNVNGYSTVSCSYPPSYGVEKMSDLVCEKNPAGGTSLWRGEDFNKEKSTILLKFSKLETVREGKVVSSSEDEMIYRETDTSVSEHTHATYFDKENEIPENSKVAVFYQDGKLNEKMKVESLITSTVEDSSVQHETIIQDCAIGNGISLEMCSSFGEVERRMLSENQVKNDADDIVQCDEKFKQRQDGICQKFFNSPDMKNSDLLAKDDMRKVHSKEETVFGSSGNVTSSFTISDDPTASNLERCDDLDAKSENAHNKERSLSYLSTLNHEMCHCPACITSNITTRVWEEDIRNDPNYVTNESKEHRDRGATSFSFEQCEVNYTLNKGKNPTAFADDVEVVVTGSKLIVTKDEKLIHEFCKSCDLQNSTDLNIKQTTSCGKIAAQEWNIAEDTAPFNATNMEHKETPCILHHHRKSCEQRNQNCLNKVDPKSPQGPDVAGKNTPLFGALENVDHPCKHTEDSSLLFNPDVMSAGSELNYTSSHDVLENRIALENATGPQDRFRESAISTKAESRLKLNKTRRVFSHPYLKTVNDTTENWSSRTTFHSHSEDESRNLEPTNNEETRCATEVRRCSKSKFLGNGASDNRKAQEENCSFERLASFSNANTKPILQSEIKDLCQSKVDEHCLEKDGEKGKQISKMKPVRFWLESYKDKYHKECEEELVPSNSVKTIVKEFHSRSLEYPSPHSNKANDIYLRRIFFPPLAANEGRKTVRNHISEWEKSPSTPDMKTHLLETNKSVVGDKLSLYVNVQSKVAFWENAYYTAEGVEIPEETWSLKPSACTNTCALEMVDDSAEEERQQLNSSDLEALHDSGSASPRKSQRQMVSPRAVTSEKTEDSGISDDLLMCLKTSDHKRIPVLSRQRSLSDPCLGIYSTKPTDLLPNFEENLNIIPSSLYCTSEEDSEEASSESQDANDEYIDDEIPDYAAMFLGDYISFTGLLGPERSSLREEAATHYLQKLEDKSRHIFDPSLSRPEECRIIGIGVHYGLVSMKNRFQVLTKGAGRGNLSVSIQGSGRHDVTTITVMYNRNDVYDVIYQVLEPGYYIISVRWSDWSIPGSPFICKVTY